MKKVVIIGGGPAGLSAAYKLLKDSKQPLKVTILEAEKQVGGISRTLNFQGNRMDLGGHRFFSKDQKIIDFWQSLFPLQGAPSYDDQKLNRPSSLAPSGPDPASTDNVMLVRNRVSRIYYNKKFFDYPPSINLKTLKNMGGAQTFQVGASYFKSLLIKNPETSLENFYINRFGEKLYQMFFESYTEKLWGIHPSKISPEWGAQRVKGLSVSSVIKNIFTSKDKKETSLIENFWYPKFGPGHFYDKLANEVIRLGGKIEKNATVTNINLKNNKITSVKIRKNQKTTRLSGDVFISSIPIKDLIASLTPTAPSKIQNIAKNLPYRDFITIGILAKKIRLTNKTETKTLGNIPPDCWIYIQEPNIKMGRIQIFNNWSPYMVKDPDHSVFLGLEYFCSEGDNFWQKTDAEIVEFATKELQKMSIIDKKHIQKTYCTRVKKAYPAYFGVYKDFHIIRTFLDKIPNLYCIGRNGQHRYNNMDHSILTAFAAVENILNNNPKKDNIWAINTEQEYHESRKS